MPAIALSYAAAIGASISSGSRIAGHGVSLEEAAATLGAGPLETFRRITGLEDGQLRFIGLMAVVAGLIVSMLVAIISVNDLALQ